MHAAPSQPPPVTARTEHDALPVRPGVDPLELLDELRRDGVRGVALLESADLAGDRGSPRRSILVTRALLRVEVLADGARVVEPLVPGAERLVDELERRAPDAPAPTPPLEAEARLRAPEPLLDFIRAAAGLVGDRAAVPFPAGIVGAFGYDVVDRFENIGPRKPDPFDEPDASFVVVGDIVVFDHREGTADVVTRGMPWEAATEAKRRHVAACERVRALRVREDDPAGTRELAAVVADVQDATFLDSVSTLREHIRDGDVFQAVISRGLSNTSSARPTAVYRALRTNNPSPYMFFLDLGVRGDLFGASPETFLKVESGVVEIRPIAGTVPRGFAPDGTIDHDADGRLALSLLLDRKEQAEHAMLLDLARNDIARVSKPGTTDVVQQFAVEKYSHVQHLVSRVRGELRDGLDAMHAYRAAANMGTLTGAPKPKAMELIRSLEPNARGFYGGAAGYLLHDGSFDSCIVIRSLRYRDGTYHTRTGAGVVQDSDPRRELAETDHKSRACRLAIAVAEVGP
ncbi:MAG: anthranilate synthase component I family protein [Planctomycetes bacterium]|nr:anthranilate synthase component I family protein [Planctomycetota bacterium]